MPALRQALQFSPMIYKAIDQRARPVARPRMHDQARWVYLQATSPRPHRVH